jgi:hypothetical protein
MQCAKQVVLVVLLFAAQAASTTCRIRNDENREDHEKNERCTIHSVPPRKWIRPTPPMFSLHQHPEDPDDDWAETDDVERWHQT